MRLDYAKSNDAILTSVMPEVDYDEGQAIAGRLLDHMKEEEDGYGLAANQVGVEARVFVVSVGGLELSFVNPCIESLSDDYVVLDEACLSFPGLNFKVRRPKSVTISWQDGDERKTATFGGLSARVIQHEIDHLDGVRFFDRLSKLQRDRFRKKYSNQLKNLGVK